MNEINDNSTGILKAIASDGEHAGLQSRHNCAGPASCCGIPLDDVNVGASSIASGIRGYGYEEENLILDEARLESFLRISQYRAETQQDLLEFALNEALRLTKSKAGNIYSYDESTKRLKLSASLGYTVGVGIDKETVYELDKSGLWEEAVNLRGPVMVNTSGAWKPLEKHLSRDDAVSGRCIIVPVFKDAKIIALGAVAGKADNYGPLDVRHVTLIMGWVWKIAGQKGIEARIKKAAEEWRTTFDSIEDMIMILDRNLAIVRLNKATALFFGMSYGEILGRHCYSIMHEDGIPLETCPYVTMCNTRRREEIELFNKRMNTWISISVDPILDGKGNVVGAVHIVKDITERKKGEEALRESEERYRAIFENAFEGIFQSDSKGRVNKVNPALVRMAGFDSPEEMITRLNRRDYHLFVKMEENRRYHKMMEEQGFVERFEVEVRKKNRETMWVLMNVHTVKDETGNMLQTEGTVIDISQPKKAQEELSESEMKYRRLFEGSGQAILVLHGSAIIDCNTKALTMFGCTRDDLINTAPDRFAPATQPDGVNSRQLIAKKVRAAVSGSPQYFDLQMMRKDGSLFDAQLILGGVRLRQEALVMVAAQDITPRRQAEEMIRKVMSELEMKNAELENTYTALKLSQQRVIQQEKMASIGQLAAGVAHEINNPVGFVMSNITSMHKYADRLSEFIRIQEEAFKMLSSGTADFAALMEDVDEKRRLLKIDHIVGDLRNIIKESLEGTERVKRIVQDLKSFSRVDESEQKLADINSGVESTINVVWNELKYKATVIKEYGEIPLTKCRLGQLNQVFMNILVNAAQAIHEQGTISVKTWLDNEYIAISISDTGSGIPEDELKRIFEPFFTTKEVGKGTGLGLSIAYDIIKKHKGEISVVSDIGRGTTFTIHIPVVGA